jgi:hypothetical protein
LCLSERGLPLYQLLKKAVQFTWTPKAQEALDKVKELLTMAPILVPLAEKEPLLLYIVATTQVVSVVLVVEREEEGHSLKVQRPMYFISDILSDSKTHYPEIQKLLYVILITKRKLRHYFKSHPVTVVTSFPFDEVIHNRDATGKIMKWALELMSQGLTYSLKQPSSHRCWLISLQSGPRSKCHRRSSTRSTG